MTKIGHCLELEIFPEGFMNGTLQNCVTSLQTIILNFARHPARNSPNVPKTKSRKILRIWIPTTAHKHRRDPSKAHHDLSQHSMPARGTGVQRIHLENFSTDFEHRYSLYNSVTGS